MASPTNIPLPNGQRGHGHRTSLSGALADPRAQPGAAVSPASPWNHYRRSSISVLASEAYAAATSPPDASSGSPVLLRAPSLSSAKSSSTFSTTSPTAADDLDPFTLPPPSSPRKSFAAAIPAPRVASAFSPVNLGRRESLNFGRRFSASSWLGLGGGGAAPQDTKPAEPPSLLAQSLPPENEDMGRHFWNGPIDPFASAHQTDARSEVPAPKEPAVAPERRARTQSRSNSFQIRRPSPRGERFLMGQLDMH